MSCRSPFGNTPHMLHAFGLFFAQTAWTCTTHGIFWALRPDTSPDSHARITCVYCSATSAYICPILPRRASAARKKRYGQTTFFAISHNDIIKNFNVCQANFPFFAKLSGMMPASFCFFPIFSHRAFSTGRNAADI